jgi:hypothetical protein
MWFYNLVASLGYCKQDKPKKETRIGANGKIRYYYRVRTFSFSSFPTDELWAPTLRREIGFMTYFIFPQGGWII